MKRYLIYLILTTTLIFRVYQYACSIPASERKIYFKDNIIDTLQFRVDLKYFNELNKSNYDSLLMEGYNLLNQSRAIDFTWGLFIANFEISYAHLNMGTIDSAMYYANITMGIAEKNGEPEWVANAHKRIGSCYEASSNYEKAIFHYIACEKIARANNLNELLIDILHSKGILYRQMEDYKTALFHFNSIRKEFPESLSSFDQFRIANNIANVYYDQELYDKALEYFNQAKMYAIETGDSIHIALLNQNLGNVLFGQGKYSEAERFIREAIGYFSKTNQKATLEMLYRTMGSIQTRKENFSVAQNYSEQALLIAKQLKNVRLQSANYHNLATNFMNWREKEPSRLDLYTKESACLRYELALQDSLFQLESTKRIHEMEKKYETEKKNNQIALLEKETEVQQNRQLFMFIGMGILVLMMGILVVAFQYVRKTNNTLLAKNQRIESQKQQIQQQNKQLEISIATQNKLFSIIAHDLRSPLASISNIGILLKMTFEKQDYETSEELVTKLAQRNNQILQLTDNLLNWANSQTGKMQFNLEKCNLKRMILESISVFEESLAQKNINLNIQIANDVEIIADDLSIKTVFRNLINNAVKFTKQGGRITINQYIEGDHTIIKISDTGIGIPAYMQDIIFEVSNHKQQTGTEGEKSSGLGLVVCKEFVEHNNGRIWFESTEGTGTDFYVSLPLYQVQNIG